jgi:cold shock CspA family protein
MQGKVEWYSVTRGFGILSVVNAEGASEKFFFHVTKIKSSPDRIEQGHKAEFDINPTPPKPGFLPMAMNVVITGFGGAK